jgi:hypothetical protein
MAASKPLIQRQLLDSCNFFKGLVYQTQCAAGGETGDAPRYAAMVVA